MFFGINPAYKPNPNEMQLFKITLNKTFPLDIKDISLHYDIYNVSDNYIYFITYTKPVINTTPHILYISIPMQSWCIYACYTKPTRKS